MPYAQSRGVKIYFDVVGQGRPLLLLHCMPLDHSIWMYQLGQYSKRFKMICLDFRSLGMSDKPETPLTAVDLVQDVRSVLADIGVKSCLVAGVSIGGVAALQYALDYPGEVEGLVLSGCQKSTQSAYLQELFSERKRCYASPDFESYYKKHVRQLFSKAFQNSKIGAYIIENYDALAPRLNGRSIAQMFGALLKFDVSDRLHEIRVPTFVITGEEDIALDGCIELAKSIRNAKFVKVHDAGHVSCLENPMAYDTNVFPFLSGIIASR